MLKIFALILPLYENLRNDFPLFMLLFPKEGDTEKDARTLNTKVKNAALVSTKTTIPIIGLN